MRWRILRIPILLNAKAAEDLFKVCCLLHNQLHYDDGRRSHGSVDAHWTLADTATDARRAAEQRAAEGLTGVAGVNVQGDIEEDDGFAIRRKCLVDHYMYMSTQRLLRWLRPWNEVREQPQDTEAGVAQNDAGEQGEAAELQGEEDAMCWICGSVEHDAEACPNRPDPPP